MRGVFCVVALILSTFVPINPAEASSKLHMRQQLLNQHSSSRQQNESRNFTQSGKRNGNEQQRLHMLKDAQRESRNEYKDILDYEDRPDFNYWY